MKINNECTAFCIYNKYDNCKGKECKTYNIKDKCNCYLETIKLCYKCKKSMLKNNDDICCSIHHPLLLCRGEYFDEDWIKTIKWKKYRK